MADSQVPWGVDALGGTISEAAWASKPSWYLITTEDRIIPPRAQREMSGRTGATVEEAAAGHSVYVSQPGAVAEIVKKVAVDVPELVAIEDGRGGAAGGQLGPDAGPRGDLVEHGISV